MLHLPPFPVRNSRQYFVSVSSSHSSNSHFGTHRAEFVMAVYPVPSIAKCGSDSGAVTCWGWVGSYFLQTSPQTPSISLSISHDLVSPGISELSVFGSNVTAALVLFLGAQRKMEPGDQMLAEALITSCWLSCCWLFDPMGKHPFLNCIGKKKNTACFVLHIFQVNFNVLGAVCIMNLVSVFGERKCFVRWCERELKSFICLCLVPDGLCSQSMRLVPGNQL